MTPEEALLRLARVLRAENDALAANDVAAATRLLPEKQRAVEAVRAAMPLLRGTPADAAALRALLTENAERLALAIEVQGRILELVGRAARTGASAASYYGRNGAATNGAAAASDPVAMTMRA